MDSLLACWLQCLVVVGRCLRAVLLLSRKVVVLVVLVVVARESLETRSLALSCLECPKG